MPTKEEVFIDVRDCTFSNVDTDDMTDTPTKDDSDSYKLSKADWLFVCRNIDLCLDQKRSAYKGKNAAASSSHATFDQPIYLIPGMITDQLWSAMGKAN